MASPLTSKRIDLPSRLDDVDPAVNQIMSEIQAQGYPEAERFGIQLAIHEALMNAVKHGNRLNPEKHVIINYQVTPEQVIIDIKDQGKGFDPEDVPDPTDLANIDKPFGRGLLLMNAYMQEVVFNPTGNAVHMVHHRQQD